MGIREDIAQALREGANPKGFSAELKAEMELIELEKQEARAKKAAAKKAAEEEAEWQEAEKSKEAAKAKAKTVRKSK